jgi:hypothetical protein
VMKVAFSAGIGSEVSELVRVDVFICRRGCELLAKGKPCPCRRHLAEC